MDTARLFTLFFFFVVFGAFAEYEAGRRIARFRLNHAGTRAENPVTAPRHHVNLSRLQVGWITSVVVGNKTFADGEK